MKAPVATPEPSAVAPESPAKSATSGAASRMSSPGRRAAGSCSALASVCVLVFLDLCGLALALYGALALREVVLREHADPLGRPLGRGGRVAAVRRAGHRPRLLAGAALREPRAPRGLRPRRLVAGRRRAAHVRLRARHRPRVLDVRPDPDGAGLRGGADRAVPRELRRRHARDVPRRSASAGARCSRARASTCSSSTGRSARARGGIDYEFVGLGPPPSRRLPLPVLGSLDTLRAVLESNQVDELIVTDSDFDERQLLEMVDQAHRRGRQGAHRAEDDGAPDEARGLRAGPGDAAVRDPAAGASSASTGSLKRGFDMVVVARRARDRPADLGRDRGRREAHVPRARLLPRPPGRARRARVRDAQVPDDVRGRGDAAAGARARERGARRAVQDPRRPARDPRRRASSAASRSTRSRTWSTSCAAR